MLVYSQFMYIYVCVMLRVSVCMCSMHLHVLLNVSCCVCMCVCVFIVGILVYGSMNTYVMVPVKLVPLSTTSVCPHRRSLNAWDWRHGDSCTRDSCTRDDSMDTHPVTPPHYLTHSSVVTFGHISSIWCYYMKLSDTFCTAYWQSSCFPMDKFGGFSSVFTCVLSFSFFFFFFLSASE